MQAQYLDQYLARYHFCTSFDRGQCLHEFFVQATKLYPFGLTADFIRCSWEASRLTYRPREELDLENCNLEGYLLVD